MIRPAARRLALAALALAVAGPALADKMKNPVAVFAGLDKITGRIIAFEVNIDETVQFGSLQLTPRVCFSRPTYENPQTDTFVEVDEVGQGNDYKRIFTGWMFAASPGLNAIEHPVYDIWLTDCKGGTEIIKVEKEKEEESTPASLPTARPQRPPQTPGRSQQAGAPGQPGVPGQPGQLAPPRPQPSQSFFPTNRPPAGGGANHPLRITPPTPN
jgi:hypothetical protein